MPVLVKTYLRFTVSHVLQNQLEQVHCIFLLLFVSSEDHWLFDWVLGEWDRGREKGRESGRREGEWGGRESGENEGPEEGMGREEKWEG